MYKNGERVMAWVAKVESVIKHPNADTLDICMVGGWKCVTRKDEFEPGELVVYISIDSWVPHELAPFLSRGKEPREFNGVKGERLRTIKLRNEISQGLILPVSVITQDGVNGQEYPFIEGSDVTELAAKTDATGAPPKQRDASHPAFYLPGLKTGVSRAIL